MTIRFQIELGGFEIIEPQQIQRRQITGGIIQKKVFGTRVRCFDLPVVDAGVPFIDGRLELHAGVCTAPGGQGDLVPEFAGRHRLLRLRFAALLGGVLQLRAPIQVPRAVFVYRLHERIGDADGVVAVLSTDGVIGFARPVRIVFLDFDCRDALLGELNDAGNVVFGHQGRAGAQHGLAEVGVFHRVVTIVDIRKLDDRFQHGIHMQVQRT